MWIFSKYGFFSVVEKLPGEFHVRARRREDLENLVREDEERSAAASIPRGSFVIHDTPTGDYCSRLVISGDHWRGRIAPILFRSIDYTNFKGEIYRTDDQADKVGLLHRIWAIMANYQEARGHPPYSTNYPDLSRFAIDEGDLADFLDAEDPDLGLEVIEEPDGSITITGDADTLEEAVASLNKYVTAVADRKDQEGRKDAN